ncbi:MAG: S-ribosylhomocysteine lyase [Clostridia bacterium]|nr:S-ribosylhomocysteine lyase [Clostridia bacterium]
MSDNVKRIQSFTVNHNTLTEGIYISRVDRGVVTYDLRTRKPNSGDYMDHSTMHTLEHMFATYVRNSEISDSVLYFGPMGCQTGFYLLVSDDVTPQKVYEITVDVLKKTIAHTGEVFGNSAVECGNYRSLDLSAAKAEAIRYLAALEAEPHPDFKYN